MKSVLLEGLILVCAGAVLAFAANALSPVGISIKTDYFPPPPPLPAQTNTAVAPGTVTPADPHSLAALTARLAARGLHLADSNRVAELFADPRRQQNQVVFIDARNDKHFEEKRIPGAYQFDHYHPEKFVPKIVPLCQAAEVVVVYCTGGDCEDSEFAAALLGDLGIAREKILVYGGGITEWVNLGRPTESGGSTSR